MEYPRLISAGLRGARAAAREQLGHTEPTKKRFELRAGKWGPYFHDTQRGGKDGYDMPLYDVLEKLNRLEDYTQRLAKANEGKSDKERV